MIKITETQLRKIIRQEILREAGDQPPAKKDAADVEKLKGKIDAMWNSLEGAFKSIDNPAEIQQAIAYLIEKITSTGGVDKPEVMKALTGATSSAKKKEV